MRGLSAVFVVLVWGVGCLPDDWDGTYPSERADDTDTAVDSDGSDAEASDADLVGTWRSEGADLSELFQAADIAWVEASFQVNGTYTVTSEDRSGERGVFTGDWESQGGAPAGIVLEQDEPYPATAEGLYALDGDTLTFETVQVFPDYGNSPPRDDFGTSTGPGMTPGANVQIYRRR